jgi:hypothetical protein
MEMQFDAYAGTPASMSDNGQATKSLPPENATMMVS